MSKAKEKVRCSNCNKLYKSKVGVDCYPPPDDYSMCSDCNFWSERAAYANDTHSIRVDGEHYWIGDADPTTPDHCKGHGGALFSIGRANGEVVPCSNLWSQGTIPVRFRDVLPDNAKFLS